MSAVIERARVFLKPDAGSEEIPLDLQNAPIEAREGHRLVAVFLGRSEWGPQHLQALYNPDTGRRCIVDANWRLAARPNEVIGPKVIAGVLGIFALNILFLKLFPFSLDWFSPLLMASLVGVVALCLWVGVTESRMRGEVRDQVARAG